MGLRLPKNSYEDAAVLFAQEQHIYKGKGIPPPPPPIKITKIFTDMWDFMTRDQVAPDQQSFMNVISVYCNLVQVFI